MREYTCISSEPYPTNASHKKYMVKSPIFLLDIPIENKRETLCFGILTNLYKKYI